MTSLPIILSEGFIPVIKEGDTVTIGMVLAKKDAKEHEVLNIAEILVLPVGDAIKTLKKDPGEKIAKGEILAEKKGFLTSDKITSSIDGVILRVERDTGNVAIQLDTTHSDVTDILSPIDGTVVVCDNEKIVITTDKDVIVGTKGNGKVVRAILHTIDHSKGDDVAFYHLDGDIIGKVILGKKFSREVLAKSIGMGVMGILGEEIADDDIFYLKEKGMDTPVIGITTEDYMKLVNHHEKEVYLDGLAKTILLLHI